MSYPGFSPRGGQKPVVAVADPLGEATTTATHKQESNINLLPGKVYEAVEIGITEFLGKPFDRESLAMTLNRMMDMSLE